jgi:hypothetical protein
MIFFFIFSRTSHNGSTPTPSSTSFDLKPVSKEEAGTVNGDGAQQEEPEVDIVINNVVTSFNVRCHLNLREIALRGLNVEYKKENGVSPDSLKLLIRIKFTLRVTDKAL